VAATNRLKLAALSLKAKRDAADESKQAEEPEFYPYEECATFLCKCTDYKFLLFS